MVLLKCPISILLGWTCLMILQGGKPSRYSHFFKNCKEASNCRRYVFIFWEKQCIWYLYIEKKGYKWSDYFLNDFFFNYVYLLDHIDDSEKLRPEELNQQTIEALVAESNLVLMILHILLWLCLWGWNKCWHQFYAYWSL